MDIVELGDEEVANGVDLQSTEFSRFAPTFIIGPHGCTFKLLLQCLVIVQPDSLLQIFIHTISDTSSITTAACNVYYALILTTFSALLGGAVSPKILW